MSFAGLILPWWGRWALVAAMLAAFGGFCAFKGEESGRTAVQAKWDHEKLAQAQAYAKELSDAKVKGDALTKQLQSNEEAISQLGQEKQNEVVRYIHDSKCLDAGAVRVLNSGASPVAVSKAPTGPAKTDAGGPAADTGNAASDRDISGWIGAAQSLYSKCSAQLDALIDFIER